MNNSDELKALEDVALELRRLIIKSLHKAGSGHPGASLSIADMVAALMFSEMSLEGVAQDRLILSKGHAVPALYAAFSKLGWIHEDELYTLRRLGSRLQGHPDMTRLPFLDAGSGALGQGVSIAIGYALGAKLKGLQTRVYCIVGDGEVQEGQIWEAAMYAPHAKLDNLCVLVDYNKLQNETWVANTLALDPLVHKWEGFGWNVVDVDGHDMAAICNAFGRARDISGKPSVIIANTVKGKGVPFMENNNAWHGGVITDAHFSEAMAALEN